MDEMARQGPVPAICGGPAPGWALKNKIAISIVPLTVGHSGNLNRSHQTSIHPLIAPLLDQDHLPMSALLRRRPEEHHLTGYIVLLERGLDSEGDADADDGD